MIDRVLPFEGIHNFRDYGGYRARGGTIRTGLLYRSGQHAGATSADLAEVSKLGIATVIDLRGDSERAHAPCLRAPDFVATVLFAPGETAGNELAPHEEAGRGVRDADAAHAAMTALYATMPFRPVLVGSLRLYFEALAMREGPSLLHCLAGKDRTGLAAALLHSLIGVHADDIMADYMLTNTAGNQERRIASAAASIRARYDSEMSDDAIRTLMGVDAVYLETALAAIRSRHGDVALYAEAVLGVDAARLAAIEARLLV